MVAFPTETVYGLGASALDARAVARVFAIKCRPTRNPLIVHVRDADAARSLAADWPEAAQALAERYWPGPLTLVVDRAPDVPDLVTAGGPTVALRAPAHPLAQRLLAETGLPLVGPSANPSGRVSPTCAQHIRDSFPDDDLLVLDGGACEVGIESTVVRPTAQGALILRPGPINAGDLYAALADAGLPAIIETHERAHASGPALSPGLMGRHYAPSTPALLLNADAIRASVTPRDAVLARGDDLASASDRVTSLPDDAAEYAARLYAALRDADASGAERILVHAPPEPSDPNHDPWAAIRDRLVRATSPDGADA